MSAEGPAFRVPTYAVAKNSSTGVTTETAPLGENWAADV